MVEVAQAVVAPEGVETVAAAKEGAVWAAEETAAVEKVAVETEVESAAVLRAGHNSPRSPPCTQRTGNCPRVASHRPCLSRWS